MKVKLFALPVVLVSLIISNVPLQAVFSISQNDFDAVYKNTVMYDPDYEECSPNGTSAAVTAAQPSQPGPVYVIGDSISFSAFTDIQDAFSTDGWSVNTNAVPGRPIKETLINEIGSEPAELEKLKSAKYVVIELGANNLRGDVTPLITATIDRVKFVNPQAKIFWVDVGSNADGIGKNGSRDIGIAVSGSTPTQYSNNNKAIYKLASEKGYTVIPWFKTIFGDGGDPQNINPAIVDTNNLLNNDELHLTLQGRKALAFIIAVSVKSSVSNPNNVATAATPGNTVDGGGIQDLEGHKLPATKGGGGNETAIDENGRLVAHGNSPVSFAHHAKLGQEYRDYYITMRWRYATWSWNGNAKKGSEDKSWYSSKPRLVLVTNPRTGKSIIAAILESGPAPWTGTPQGKSTPHPYWQGFIEGTPEGYNGRVAGFPPVAVQALGMAQWQYGGPGSGHKKGSGDELLFSWAPDQNAKPGPTDLTQSPSSGPGASPTCATSTSTTTPGGGGIGIGEGGFTFPLKTTKAALAVGTDGLKWTPTQVHHHYPASDIFVETGTEVIAAMPGKVVKTTDASTGAGTRVQIKGTSDGGLLYYYAHMLSGSLKVKAGDVVAAGQPLGQVGRNQEAFGTARHLHIDILPNTYQGRVDCKSAGCMKYPWVDVMPYLRSSYEKLP